MKNAMRFTMIGVLLLGVAGATTGVRGADMEALCTKWVAVCGGSVVCSEYSGDDLPNYGISVKVREMLRTPDLFDAGETGIEITNLNESSAGDPPAPTVQVRWYGAQPGDNLLFRNSPEGPQACTLFGGAKPATCPGGKSCIDNDRSCDADSGEACSGRGGLFSSCAFDQTCAPGLRGCEFMDDLCDCACEVEDGEATLEPGEELPPFYRCNLVSCRTYEAGGSCDFNLEYDSQGIPHRVGPDFCQEIVAPRVGGIALNVKLVGVSFDDGACFLPLEGIGLKYEEYGCD